MAMCSICKEPASEQNGLCADCGKHWNESVIRKSQDDVPVSRYADQIEKLIIENESGYSGFKTTVNALLDKTNILETLNEFSETIRSRSSSTYQLLLTVLKNVLEHYPFPRVVLIRLIEFPATARVIIDNSDKVKSMINEYTSDTQRELNKSVSKKEMAVKMKRKQIRLRIEFAGLIVMSVVLILISLFLYISESIQSGLLAGLVAFLLSSLIILKFSRYNSLDMSFHTNPRLSYQIDLLDIPESYIHNLEVQLQKLEEIGVKA